RMQAKQRDEVALVRMKPHVRPGQITTHLGIAVIAPEVLDVAEHMTLRVLRDRAAEMRTDAPERDSRLEARPFGDRKAAHQHESAAVEELVVDIAEPGRKPRQRKIGAGNFDDRLTARPDAADR